MGHRLALCIGINKFPNANVDNLSYACSDAESVSKILGDPERGQFECITLLGPDATKEKIIGTFNRLLSDTQLNADDTVLVYYAGHGDVDSTSNLFFICIRH